MTRSNTAKAASSGEGPADHGSALLRGLHVLEVLRDAVRPLALAEVVESTQLASSTVHRLLQSLAQAEYIYRDDSGRYHLGANAVFPLPRDHPLNRLRRDSMDLLQALQDQFTASAMVTIFMGTQRVVLEVLTEKNSVAPYIHSQVRSPLHASVSGKLLLSGRADAERDALLGPAPYPAKTRNTLVDRQALFDELDRIARDGFATNIEENLLGISAQGACLVAPSGRQLGAVVMTGQSRHFNAQSLQPMRELLRQTADILAASASLRDVARFLNL